jgi:hypothetical protein
MDGNKGLIVRALIAAGLVLLAGAAHAQERAVESQLVLTPLPGRPECASGGAVSPRFGEPMEEAEQFLREMNYRAARVPLDRAAASAQSLQEKQMSAAAEIMFTMGTQDASRVMAAWEPVLASGCFAEDQVTTFRAGLARAVQRFTAQR